MMQSELLWLWYDYHTEKFDQQLECYPSPYDEGSVIVAEKHRHLSNRHARTLHSLIFGMAEYYQISREAMQQENSQRLRKKTKIRMAEYEHILKTTPIEFEFIQKYLNELEDLKSQTTVQKEDLKKFN